MKVSQVISTLQEILDTAGDVEVHIDTDNYFDLCREVYLLANKRWTNKMAIISKNTIEYAESDHKGSPYFRKRKK